MLNFQYLLRMPYIADLHIHSHYSRATSKDLNLESLYQWAQIKGIDVVGTGDFTHPQWFNELQTKLVPDGSGFFRLKHPPQMLALPGLKHQARDIRFCLATEISSIYKYDGRVRKNHNLLYAPDLETVAKINTKLATIGNLKADGRPILGLPARDLLEIALEASDRAYLIPAHIWTPWFSTLGSKAGYDSIEACFRDLTSHIFALETGLSSDPAMNWKLSALDRYTMVSNSDAHSPKNLGREASLFDTVLTYDALFEALKTRKGFLGTIEFFPEEGKYHLDGHRKCGVCVEPATTQAYKGLCPACGKLLTVGVLHRVEELADRTQPQQPQGAANFEYLIPLPEIVSEIKGTSPNSKGVQQQFRQIISLFGSEFAFLREAPIADIRKQLGPIYAEAIRRLRNQKVVPTPGYDGLYGTIHLFQPGEIQQLAGQRLFFENTTPAMQQRVPQAHALAKVAHKTPQPTVTKPSIQLNTAQQTISTHTQGAALVKAGPGTGKTQTLIHWLAQCLAQAKSTDSQLLAITFTNKAAEELQERLQTLLGERANRIHTGTFHGIAYQLLQERYPELQAIYSAEDRQLILKQLFPQWTQQRRQQLAHALEKYLDTGQDQNFKDLQRYATEYSNLLAERKAIDLADIVGQLLRLWETEREWLHKHRERYTALAVDELQDINPQQYQLLRALGQGKSLLAIGDPDQAIYGFRGADMRLFFQFQKDFDATEYTLEENYRTTATIVQAAQAFIQHNTLRSGLQLQAHKGFGSKISIFEADNERDEVAYVLSQIKAYVGGIDNLALGIPDEGTYAFDDMAILFRQRTVGKHFFAKLRKAGIPAHFSDGASWLAEPPFYVVGAMLRLLVLQLQDMTTMHYLFRDRLQKAGIAAVDTKKMEHQMPQFLTTFKDISEWYHLFNKMLRDQGVAAVVKAIIDRYVPTDVLDDSQRLQQATLLRLAQEAPDAPTFLRQMTLGNYTDAGRIRGEGIHLLTFHAAKGLEFPVVFIAGAEEGITPMQRSDSDLEEERRLFYVALTRAQEAVHLTWTRERKHYGQSKVNTKSRFVAELPPDCLVETTQDAAVSKKKERERQLQLF